MKWSGSQSVGFLSRSSRWHQRPQPRGAAPAHPVGGLGPSSFFSAFSLQAEGPGAEAASPSSSPSHISTDRSSPCTPWASWTGLAPGPGHTCTLKEPPKDLGLATAPDTGGRTAGFVQTPQGA